MTTRRAASMARLRELGEYRDALLVIVTLVYLLGYLSWAFYAGTNHLGLVPAVDAQYLVAGIIPSVILVVGLVLVLGQLRFARWASREPTDRRYGVGKAVSGVAIVTMLVAGITMGLLERIGSPRGESVAVAVLLVAAYASMAGALLQGSRGPAFYRRYGLFVLWFVVACVPIVLIVFYLADVFPRMPASLGGPAPQCVALDVTVADLSTSSRDLLIGPVLTGDTARVKRTRPLDLLISTSEVVMIRARDGLGEASVYSLSKQAVIGIATCAAEPNE